MNKKKQNTNFEEYERLRGIYPGIVAWGRLMRRKDIYISKQLQMAEAEQMPRDVVYLSRRQGTVSFRLFKDAVPAIRAQLTQLADDPDGVLKAGE